MVTKYGKCILPNAVRALPKNVKRTKLFRVNCSTLVRTTSLTVRSAACKAKCDMDDSCIVYASTMNGTTYSKCTFKKGIVGGFLLLATSKTIFWWISRATICQKYFPLLNNVVHEQPNLDQIMIEADGNVNMISRSAYEAGGISERFRAQSMSWRLY